MMADGLPLILFSEEENDLPDYWTELGGIFSTVDEAASITRVPLIYNISIVEGATVSIFVEDAATAYQNISGNPAYTTVSMDTFGNGTSQRHIRVWSSPVSNSTAGATLLFEVGTTDSTGFADSDTISLSDLKIEDDHYLVFENVDEGRTANNAILINNAKYFFINEYNDI